MGNDENEDGEVVYGSATGGPVWLQESARGGTPKSFIAEPKTGPGPSGGSDVTDSSSDD